MRIILWEWKKLFSPIPLLLCFGAFVLLSLNVPKDYLLAKQLLDTENYPEKFTVYDNYSIDILFHDFLLETYGNQISPAHLEELTQRREHLLDQVDAAARKDEVLLRTGMNFDREWVHFTSPPLTPMEESEHPISEEDQIYVWSCINGQMKLDGTDHPVGFLSRLDTVISTLQAGQVYNVLSMDLFYPFTSNNIRILTNFIFAAWVLIIPYGVSEARSGTEMLAFSTKQGRKSYRKKAFAASFVCLFIIGAGIWVTASLFLSTGIDRYWGAYLDSLLTQTEFGSYIVSLSVDHPMRFRELYWVLLGLTALVGLAGAVMIVHISLQWKHAVSAIACSLPVVLAFDRWVHIYTKTALDSGRRQISLVGCGIFSGLFILVMFICSTGVVLWKYKKDY